jgi:hypothetical protein
MDAPCRRVLRVMYEILPDEEFLAILGDTWSWSGRLGDFSCSIGQEKPPLIVSVSSYANGESEPRQVSDSTPGPTLVAIPGRRDESIVRVRSRLEPLLAGWAAHLELAEGIAIRFGYRAVWLEDEPEDVRVEYQVEGGDAIKVYNSIREAPAPPPRWVDQEPELVRLLRSQWRAVRDGSAKLLDRAYFCLTAVEHAYGGRRPAAERLQVSVSFLSRIGLLAASPDRGHARKVTGTGPAEFSPEDRQWLTRSVPRLIYRCLEVELGQADLSLLTTDSATW